MAKFHIPPEYQGQMVEVSFAEVYEGIVMRVYDRSDRSESYYITPWTQRLVNWSERVGSWNSPPPVAAGRWRKLSDSAAERMLGED